MKKAFKRMQTRKQSFECFFNLKRTGNEQFDSSVLSICTVSAENAFDYHVLSSSDKSMQRLIFN